MSISLRPMARSSSSYDGTEYALTAMPSARLMSAMSGVHSARDSTVPPSGSTPKRISLMAAGGVFSALSALSGFSGFSARSALSGLSVRSVFSFAAAMPCACTGACPASRPAASANAGNHAARHAGRFKARRPSAR